MNSIFFATLTTSRSPASPAINLSPTPDLIWLKLNEGSGTALTNDAAGGVDFTTNAGWSTGYQTLNGSTQWDFSNSSIAFGTLTQVTFTFWAYLNDTSTVQIIHESSDIFDSNAGAILAYIASGVIHVPIKAFAVGDFDTTYVTPSTGSWVNIALVYDTTFSRGGGKYGETKCYFNGVAQTQTVATDGMTTPTAFVSYTHHIGKRAVDNTFAWNANLDDYRCYTRELTTEEILAIYTEGPQ